MVHDESDAGTGDATQPSRSAPLVVATAPSAERSANPTPVPISASALPELPRDPIFDSIEREARAMTAPSDEAMPDSIDSYPATEAAERVDVPRLDQLEGNVRSGLPPLKLSMHVFVDDPASRFVLIDGHRYSEGQQIAAQLQLVEIRRDGALLDLSGRRFLLPRP
jgi:general secretion pathway protein B